MMGHKNVPTGPIDRSAGDAVLWLRSANRVMEVIAQDPQGPSPVGIPRD